MGDFLAAWLIIASAAFAGYGDAVDGLPTPEERVLHLWTNAMRVAPEEFEDAYPCPMGIFSDDERTPKAPLLWQDGLSAAADFHSMDMAESGALSHDSSDGTPFDERLWGYYPYYPIGENIAWGYLSAWSAVVEGWMCSKEGHRANIMSADYTELGTGVVGNYYTQDFGGRSVPPREIAMGMHGLSASGESISFYADFYDSRELAPTKYHVIVDDEATLLGLTYGEAWRGIYSGSVAATDGCHLYAFEVETEGGSNVRFPEEGSYGWGDCDFDDVDAMWSEEAVSAPKEDKPGSCPGCAGAGGVPSASLVLFCLFCQRAAQRLNRQG